MNKNFIMFFSIIFTMHHVECAQGQKAGKVDQLIFDGLNKAIIKAQSADYYNNDRVQFFTGGYVSSQVLNRNSIKSEIALPSPESQNETNKNLIVFYTHNIEKDMLSGCFDMKNKIWQDAIFENMAQQGASFLTIYVVPSGEQITLEQHCEIIDSFIRRGDPIIICFEENSALNIICELARNMVCRVRHLVCSNPNSEKEEVLLGLGNHWKHNINGFRDNVISGVAFAVIAIPLAWYVANRVFKH